MPSEARLEEDFLPGSLGLQDAGRNSGQEAVNTPSTRKGQMVYLPCVEDVGEKVVETFAKRPTTHILPPRTQRVALGAASKLQRTLPAAEGSGELIVEKMTQKFAPDGEETGEDVDVRRSREGRPDRNQVPLQEARRDETYDSSMKGGA